jgi:ABC-type multidrug transport system fused ATPase/permease subunit
MQSIQQKDNAAQQRFQLSEYIFSVCICLLVVFFLRMFQAFSALRASRGIHDKLLDNILTATLSWHDSQPQQREGGQDREVKVQWHWGSRDEQGHRVAVHSRQMTTPSMIASVQYNP